MNPVAEKSIHRLFDLGIILKGIDGVLEITGGLLLVLIKPQTINYILVRLTQYELIEDPKDKIANYILSLGHLSANSRLFGILFLLSHGIVKVLIVAALLKNKLWAYPAGIVIFAGFGVYQMYRYFHTYSPGLLVLSILDLAVILLTWHEYAVARNKLGPA